jgi:hypothetical protein
MRNIISTVSLLTAGMAVLIFHGCGSSSEMGSSVANQVSSSGIISSVQEKPAAIDQGEGSIRGVVHKRLLSNSSCTGGNAVYVFDGHNVVPDDIDRIIPDPVDYVIVKFDSGSSQYQYRISLPRAGDYTLAFTCQAGADNPDIDNYITFTGIRNVTVSSGKEIIQHLFQS